MAAGFRLTWHEPTTWIGHWRSTRLQKLRVRKSIRPWRRKAIASGNALRGYASVKALKNPEQRALARYHLAMCKALNICVAMRRKRRVTSCADRLATARRVDHHIRRELKVIHRLLSLENVDDPDKIETALFSNLDPASAEVETICRLMDMLADLLREAVPHPTTWRSKTLLQLSSGDPANPAGLSCLHRLARGTARRGQNRLSVCPCS